MIMDNGEFYLVNNSTKKVYAIRKVKDSDTIYQVFKYDKDISEEGNYANVNIISLGNFERIDKDTAIGIDTTGMDIREGFGEFKL